MRTNEFDHIVNTEDYSLLGILDKILVETYALISENIDINNSYEYHSQGSSIWYFYDSRSIKHTEEINYNPGVSSKEITVKLFWEDDDKPSYEKPPYTDEKVFNTYLKILLHEVLPIMDKYKDTFSVDKITLDPTDEVRYRLYRTSLNQLLRDSDYKVQEDQAKLLLYIKRKQ